MALTQIADVVVPSVFDDYVQQFTAEKHALIDSGVAVLDPDISAKLAGGGLTFNSPSWKDLTNDDAVQATDATGDTITPLKTGHSEEVQVRISRAQAWSDADLTGLLAGSDPMMSIASRVGEYWAREFQRTFIATMKGVFADNDANDSGDYTNDISGTYSAGLTTFSAEAFIDAVLTAGDNMADFVAIAVHSVVYARMLKNNLIDFVSDSVNPNATRVPFFHGRRVIVDDNMPYSGSTYQSWIFGAGSVRFGQTPAPMATEIEREALQGNGFGVETLVNRKVFCYHPVGHAYSGTAPSGGPTNAATTNNLAAAGSWNRVWPERKQVKIARLITTEA